MSNPLIVISYHCVSASGPAIPAISARNFCFTFSQRSSSFLRLLTRSSVTGWVSPMIRLATCIPSEPSVSCLAHSTSAPERLSQNLTASRASKPAWASNLTSQRLNNGRDDFYS